MWSLSHHGPVSKFFHDDVVHVVPLSDQRRTSRDLPVMLERYGEGFDPQTGSGDIEIWTPIKE
jgi:predicted transcriptional regulator YdeE